MRFRLLAIAPIVALAACASQPMATLQSNVVAIDIYDFYYSPTAVSVATGISYSPTGISIKTGTPVQWTNRGPSAHTATSDVGLWDSGTLNPPSPGGGGGGGGGTPPPPPPPPPPCTPYCLKAVGGSYQFTFNTPGVYGFHCSIHPPATNPTFTGTVTVTE